MAKKKGVFVDRSHGGRGEYGGDLEDIENKAVCPFCPGEGYLKWHKNPILKKKGQWLITKNTYPYENSEHHFLLIPEKHMECISEMKSQDWNDMMILVKWAICEYKIAGGGMAVRFGDTSHTGSTVCHLHIHLIVPKVNPETGKVFSGENGKPLAVYFPFG